MDVRPQDWVLLFFVLFGVVYYRFKAGRGKRPDRIRGKKPGQGDSHALRVLEEAGYTLLQVQPSLRVSMIIQEKDHDFEIKNDYLVARNGARYLVRVRPDTKPVRLHAKVWRNALLRDVLAFGVEGILVLDLNKESLQEIYFRV